MAPASSKRRSRTQKTVAHDVFAFANDNEPMPISPAPRRNKRSILSTTPLSQPDDQQRERDAEKTASPIRCPQSLSEVNHGTPRLTATRVSKRNSYSVVSQPKTLQREASVRDHNRSVSSDVAHIVPPPRRGPGRPRKKPDRSLNAPDTNELTNMNQTNIQHPIEATIESPTEKRRSYYATNVSSRAKKIDEEEIPRRRPGRPRKKRDPSPDASTASPPLMNKDSNVGVDKTSSRAQRHLCLSSVRTGRKSEARGESTPSRGPGRPRKKDVLNATTDTPCVKQDAQSVPRLVSRHQLEASTMDHQSPKRRGPGRPRKKRDPSPKASTDISASKVADVPQRASGRSRKANEVSTSEEAPRRVSERLRKTSARYSSPMVPPSGKMSQIPNSSSQNVECIEAVQRKSTGRSNSAFREAYAKSSKARKRENVETAVDTSSPRQNSPACVTTPGETCRSAKLSPTVEEIELLSEHATYKGHEAPKSCPALKKELVQQETAVSPLSTSLLISRDTRTTTTGSLQKEERPVRRSARRKTAKTPESIVFEKTPLPSAKALNRTRLGIDNACVDKILGLSEANVPAAPRRSSRNRKSQLPQKSLVGESIAKKKDSKESHPPTTNTVRESIEATALETNLKTSPVRPRPGRPRKNVNSQMQDHRHQKRFVKAVEPSNLVLTVASPSLLSPSKSHALCNSDLIGNTIQPLADIPKLPCESDKALLTVNQTTVVPSLAPESLSSPEAQKTSGICSKVANPSNQCSSEEAPLAGQLVSNTCPEISREAPARAPSKQNERLNQVGSITNVGPSNNKVDASAGRIAVLEAAVTRPAFTRRESGRIRKQMYLPQPTETSRPSAKRQKTDETSSMNILDGGMENSSNSIRLPKSTSKSQSSQIGALVQIHVDQGTVSRVQHTVNTKYLGADKEVVAKAQLSSRSTEILGIIGHVGGTIGCTEEQVSMGNADSKVGRTGCVRKTASTPELVAANENLKIEDKDDGVNQESACHPGDVLNSGKQSLGVVEIDKSELLRTGNEDFVKDVVTQVISNSVKKPFSAEKNALLAVAHDIETVKVTEEKFVSGLVKEIVAKSSKLCQGHKHMNESEIILGSTSTLPGAACTQETRLPSIAEKSNGKAIDGRAAVLSAAAKGSPISRVETNKEIKQNFMDSTDNGDVNPSGLLKGKLEMEDFIFVQSQPPLALVTKEPSFASAGQVSVLEKSNSATLPTGAPNLTPGSTVMSQCNMERNNTQVIAVLGPLKSDDVTSLPKMLEANQSLPQKRRSIDIQDNDLEAVKSPQKKHQSDSRQSIAPVDRVSIDQMKVVGGSMGEDSFADTYSSIRRLNPIVAGELPDIFKDVNSVERKKERHNLSSLDMREPVRQEQMGDNTAKDISEVQPLVSTSCVEELGGGEVLQKGSCQSKSLHNGKSGEELNEKSVQALLNSADRIASTVGQNLSSDATAPVGDQPPQGMQTTCVELLSADSRALQAALKSQEISCTRDGSSAGASQTAEAPASDGDMPMTCADGAGRSEIVNSLLIVSKKLPSSTKTNVDQAFMEAEETSKPKEGSVEVAEDNSDSKSGNTSIMKHKALTIRDTDTSAAPIPVSSYDSLSNSRSSSDDSVKFVSASKALPSILKPGKQFSGSPMKPLCPGRRENMSSLSASQDIPIIESKQAENLPKTAKTVTFAERPTEIPDLLGGEQSSAAHSESYTENESSDSMYKRSAKGSTQSPGTESNTPRDDQLDDRPSKRLVSNDTHMAEGTAFVTQSSAVPVSSRKPPRLTSKRRRVRMESCPVRAKPPSMNQIRAAHRIAGSRQANSIGNRNAAIVVKSISPEEERSQRLLLDQFQYLLDGVFQKGKGKCSVSPSDNKLKVDSLLQMLRLLRQTPTAPLRPGASQLDTEDADPVLLVCLRQQPLVLKTLVQNLLNLREFVQPIPLISMAILLVIVQGRGNAAYFAVPDVDTLVEVFFRFSGMPSSQRVDQQRSTNGSRRRGWTPRSKDYSSKKENALTVVKEMLSDEQLMSSLPLHPFTDEEQCTNVVAGYVLSKVLEQSEEARGAMMQNNSLGRVARVMYIAAHALSGFVEQIEAEQKLIAGGAKPSALYAKKIQKKNEARILTGVSMRIFESATLHDEVQKRLVKESKVTALTVKCMREILSDDELYEAEGVACCAIRLCINLTQGGTLGLTQFLESDGVQVILDCLAREAGVGVDEGLYENRMFDVRVLCLALLSSIVDQSKEVREAFQDMAPSKTRVYEGGALAFILSLLKGYGNSSESAEEDLYKDQRLQNRSGSAEMAENKLEMDKRVSTGYLCLVLGALVQNCRRNSTAIRRAVPGNCLLTLAGVIHEFLHFHHEIGLVSDNIDSMYDRIINALHEEEVVLGNMDTGGKDCEMEKDEERPGTGSSDSSMMFSAL